MLDCLRKLLGGDKKETSLSNKGRIKALRQREMVREVSSLFSTGGGGKFAKLKKATKNIIAKRNKRKGIQTLRRLSMSTLNTTVTALQGQHEEIAAATFDNVDRKVPTHYELPAASMAAHVYSQQVSKRISDEAKAIRRDITIQHRRSQWQKQAAQQAAAATTRAQLRKTATSHNLVDRVGSASTLLHTQFSQSARHVQFSEKADGAVSAEPRCVNRRGWFLCAQR